MPAIPGGCDSLAFCPVRHGCHAAIIRAVPCTDVHRLGAEDDPHLDQGKLLQLRIGIISLPDIVIRKSGHPLGRGLMAVLAILLQSSLLPESLPGSFQSRRRSQTQHPAGSEDPAGASRLR